MKYINKRQNPHDYINRYRKAFDKVSCIFMIKTRSKLKTEGNFLNLIKSIYKKPTAYITLNGERPSFLPLTITIVLKDQA